MKKFKILNNALGWLTFLVAAMTYCLTVEPTASFWDCPEFILSANKLEVGHPPGAPFFMLTANFFSLFAGPAKVALMVNIMSAILSALGILFLFWSITHLARKLIVGNSTEITTAETITILASGLVGALAYTWSDTYWFSAVEGEVYGYSSLFTAVVFWLILKWEDNASSPHSDRWLILISYLVGLSIGVHLLNLLCIPAIILVVYYKKYPNANWKGSLLALLVSMILVAVVLYGIVPGVVKVGGWFELLFVNVLGMPFNTGLIIYIVLLFAALIAGIVFTEKNKEQKKIAAIFTATIALLGIPFYGNSVAGSIVLGIIILIIVYKISTATKKSTQKSFTAGGGSKAKIVKKPVISLRAFNSAFLCMLLIMIGYSSYTLILIRSAANTPMDQNSPEDIFTLGTYLNREQYGTRPLLWGEGFDSEIEVDMAKGEYVYVDTSPVYGKVEKKNPGDPDEYMIVEYNQEPVYIQTMFFPRMYSKKHAALYENWIGDTVSNTVRSTYPHPRTGQHYAVKVPTFGDNMSFFINYQVNHMYWRYFLWNFVGRQNDIQGNGEIEFGNWVTGIGFIDEILIGGQDQLPTEMKENKGYNVYFALPLILGIIGLVWQLSQGKKGKQQFWVVFMLFFMTGLAIVLYLNQTPNQPRERDYAYAGSFYAFAIWIGLGVAGIVELIKRFTKKESAVVNCIIAAASLLVPLQMVSQTWDDHDRSGRFVCRDVGQNYLNSLSESGYPIIFTCGDNDTFPLWYNQEVEGEGTDARVCNLSYLHTDWYIDQMRRPAYDSPSLPITWERIDYAGNTNHIIYVYPIESIIEEYRKQFPEKFNKAFGNNPYDFNNITKYWILGADDPVKSEGRLVVEEIIALAQRVVDVNQREYGGAFKLPNKFIPTDKVYIPIDKEAVIRSGMKIPAIYDEKLGGTMPEYMIVPLESSAVYRRDLIIFDMLANANWERPIYMSTTVGYSEYPAALQDFFISEGLAYRISPFNWTEARESSIDIDKYYHNIMNRYKWGGIKEAKSFYADETVTRMIYTHRNLITTLAIAMLQEKRPDAEIFALLEKMRQEIPVEVIPYNATRDNSVSYREGYPSLLTVYSYLYSQQSQYKETGDAKYIGDEQFNLLYSRLVELAESVVKNESEYLNWYNHLDKNDRSEYSVCQRAIILKEVLRQTGVDTFGNINGKQLFDILYNGIAYEYNILADPEIKLSQERFEYKIQSITTQYQAIAELNVSDEDNRRIEALIYKVMALIQQ